MRNLISKIRFERFLKAFSGQAPDQGVKPGPREVLEIQEALALSEAMMCDILAHCAEDESAAHDRGSSSQFASVNAFGRPVATIDGPRAGEAIACGIGAALSGLRTAVFLAGDDLSEGYAQLQVLAGRQIPMVVHATFREGYGAGASHVGYHAASDLGLFLAMPRSVQQALDLTLLARWLTERALIPGLVAVDRRIVESASLPNPELITRYLAEPSTEFDAPNKAQLKLFGTRRPGVPSWFDLDRPLAFGTLQGSNDGASAAVGREAFFLGGLRDLLQKGSLELSKLTGRPLSMVDQEGLDRAEIVLVTQGSAYETARAAARHLREEKKVSVGVLGLTWLRPFPVEEVRTALAGRKSVVVLECSGALLSEEGPLMREVRRAARQDSLNWVSAGFGSNGQPLSVGQIVDLVGEVRDRKAPSRVWLGVVSGRDRIGDFPKREGLVQSIGADYPQLARIASSGRAAISVGALKTVQWIGGAAVDTSEVLSRLADACMKASGPGAKGFSWYPEPGVLSVRISSGPEDVPVAESGTGVDVLLLGRHGLDLVYNPLTELKSGGFLVFDTDRTIFEIWQLMPDFWRSEVRRLKLRMFRVNGFEDLVTAASRLLAGDSDLPFEEVRPQTENSDGTSEEVPALIRRIRETEDGYDSVSRFWGEIMQPKRGGVSDNFPDPLVTVGAVPSYTAALARPRATARPQMPVLQPEKCTGCGRCWPVCPDSAIGVTLLTPAEFLDAASDAAGNEGRLAGAVKRAHRNVGARLTSDLVQSAAGTITEGMLMDAYRGAVAKMPVKTEERPEYDRIFAATAESANRLSPVVCETFFRAPEKSQKGGGRLVLLAINPDACQGCRLCIASCPEAALAPYDRAGSTWADAREGWRLWENLPDPAPEVMEQAVSKLDHGTPAARLLSRRCSQVQAVGSFGEPGSGERLATRLVAAMVESHVRQQISTQAATAVDLAAKLKEQLHAQLALGLTSADPAAIESVLTSLPRRRVSLAEVSDKLSALGRTVSVDPVKTMRLAQNAHELESIAWELKEGPGGIGRSGFGVVVAGSRIACWAGRFPNHPYRAPLVVDPTPEGASLALGLAQAAALRHLEEMKAVRRAALYLENPSDLPGRLVMIQELTWSELTWDERKSCPPLLVFMDESALSRQGLGAVSRMMASDLPVKLVLLDGKGPDSAALEPALLGISLQNAFVLASSPAYPSHLADGVLNCLDYAGPALLHLHVPLPQEHGFDTSLTLEQGRRAVESRMHPLLVFDPGAPGGFGARISLAGNPDLDEQGWAGYSPVEWAAGERRFRRFFNPVSPGDSAVDLVDYLAAPPAERTGLCPAASHPETGEPCAVARPFTEIIERRLRLWATYQEMAGLKSSFLDEARAEARAEAEAEGQQQMMALRAEYEARAAQAEAELDGRMAAILRDRLMALAGFGPESQIGS